MSFSSSRIPPPLPAQDTSPPLPGNSGVLQRNSSFRNSSRRPSNHRHHKGVSPEVIKVLCKLPLITAPSLSTWLYSARVLKEEEKIYWDILEYVRNGQEHGYGIKVCNILRIVREGDIDFEHMSSTRRKFRMILWHGTKENVISSILRTGFVVPGANNQMFGQGIYFADRCSKSVNYCHNGTVKTPATGTKAYLLLCDVLLGKVYNSKNPKVGLTQVPAGNFESLMCTGKKVPDRAGNKYLKKSIIPCGPTIQDDKFPSHVLQYNEYIVYDTSKIRIKYLVEVKICSNLVMT